MFLPSEESQKLQRSLLANRCENRVDSLLQFGSDYFFALFPNSTIASINSGTRSTWPSSKVIRLQGERIKRYILDLLKLCNQICDGEEDYVLPGESISIPHKIKETVLETCVRMLVFGRDLTDIEYYFLDEVGKALKIGAEEVYGVIEQVLYEERKAIFMDLKQHLSTKQKEVCAMLLVKAIRADDRVHPAEIKYFEIVSDLLEYNQARLEKFYRSFDMLEKDLPMSLTDEISVFLFKYLVEIVMCDKHYDPEESLFIKKIAEAFNMDRYQQDAILQPITAALMVKADLFQKHL
ncbi:TerB family tellurite resistance protein [bacterium]|nr:TerB family tellurite resistance protein [bacterium]